MEEKVDGWIVVSANGKLALEFPAGIGYIFPEKERAESELADINEAGWRVRPVKLLFLDDPQRAMTLKVMGQHG